MSDKAREAFAEKIAAQGATYEQVTLSLIGYDAARAEYLPVVEKLVDAIENDALPFIGYLPSDAEPIKAKLRDAIALAAPLLGGK